MVMGLVSVLDPLAARSWRSYDNYPHLMRFDTILSPSMAAKGGVVAITNVSLDSRIKELSLGSRFVRVKFQWAPTVAEQRVAVEALLRQPKSGAPMRRFVYASASLWDIGTPGRPPHAEKEVRARFADYCGNFARQLANACHKTGATCALGLMPDIPSIGAYAHFAKVQRDLCAPTSCDLQQRLSIVDIHTLTANLQHERTVAHFSHVASILEYHAIFDAWLSFLSRLADDTTLQLSSSEQSTILIRFDDACLLRPLRHRDDDMYQADWAARPCSFTTVTVS